MMNSFVLKMIFLEISRNFNMRRIEQFHFYRHLQLRLFLLLHLVPRVALPLVAYPGLLIFDTFSVVCFYDLSLNLSTDFNFKLYLFFSICGA